MAEATTSPGQQEPPFLETLGRLSERVAQSRVLKPGDIVFRLIGPGGGSYVLRFDDGRVRVAETTAPSADRTPLIEVIGDAATIRAVLAGRDDARRRFLAGGFRVRGDLRYLSDVALELGLIREPL